MGFFDKLAFWKKSDDIGDIGGKGKGPDDLGGFDQGFDNLGLNSGDMGDFQNPQATPQPGFQQPPQQQFQQPQMQQSPLQAPSQQYQQPQQYNQPSGYAADKDFEVISSKLDALRAVLDSINQRLTNIENLARGEEQDNKRRYYRY